MFGLGAGLKVRIAMFVLSMGWLALCSVMPSCTPDLKASPSEPVRQFLSPVPLMANALDVSHDEQIAGQQTCVTFTGGEPIDGFIDCLGDHYIARPLIQPVLVASQQVKPPVPSTNPLDTASPKASVVDARVFNDGVVVTGAVVTPGRTPTYQYRNGYYSNGLYYQDGRWYRVGSNSSSSGGWWCRGPVRRFISAPVRWFRSRRGWR